MRALLFLLAVLLAWPAPVGAEGVLHPRDPSPSLKNFRSDCRPGLDPVDPKCCAATLVLCRAKCQDDYAQNGDMLYLRHCERECEGELGLCRAGRQ